MSIDPLDDTSGFFRILIVEDDDVFSEYLRSLVESCGLLVLVSVVHTLAEAVKVLSVNRYSLILLDLNLPDSQGLKTIDVINKVVVVPPTVVITGYFTEEMELGSFRRGVQEYVDKTQVASRGPTYMRAIILRSINRHKGFADHYLTLLRTVGAGALAESVMLPYGPLEDQEKGS